MTMNLQSNGNRITGLGENEIIQLHNVVLFTWFHVEPDPADAADQIGPILLHRPAQSIRISRFIDEANIIGQDTTELLTNRLRLLNKGKSTIPAELHLDSNPMLIIETTLKGFIINTKHDLTRLTTKVDRLTCFLFTIYDLFFYQNLLKLRYIFPIMRIHKQLIHIQNTRVIIKGNIQASHMKLLRIILKKLKQAIEVTGTLRLKDTAALTGHFQTSTHIRLTYSKRMCSGRAWTLQSWLWAS